MKKEKKEKKVKKAKKSYISEVFDELEKVNWPDKTTMVKFTVAVIVFCIIFAVYFYALDIVMSWIIGA